MGPAFDDLVQSPDGERLVGLLAVEGAVTSGLMKL